MRKGHTSRGVRIREYREGDLKDLVRSHGAVGGEADHLRWYYLENPRVDLDLVYVAEVAGRARSTARIVPLEVCVDGNVVPVGGIATVATHPAYRRRGLAGALTRHALYELRERGIHLSLLHPFAHAFYRRYGFELATEGIEYTLKPTDLPTSPEQECVRAGEASAVPSLVVQAAGVAYARPLGAYSRVIQHVEVGRRRERGRPGEQRLRVPSRLRLQAQIPPREHERLRARIREDAPQRPGPPPHPQASQSGDQDGHVRLHERIAKREEKLPLRRQDRGVRVGRVRVSLHKREARPEKGHVVHRTPPPPSRNATFSDRRSGNRRSVRNAAAAGLSIRHRYPLSRVVPVNGRLSVSYVRAIRSRMAASLSGLEARLATVVHPGSSGTCVRAERSIPPSAVSMPERRPSV